MQLVTECSRPARISVHKRRSPVLRSNQNLRDSSTRANVNIRKTVSVDRSTSSHVRPNGGGKFSYENDIFVIPVHRVVTRPNPPQTTGTETLSDNEQEHIQNMKYSKQGHGVRLLDIPKLHLESIDGSVSKSNDDERDPIPEGLGATPYVKPQERRRLQQTTSELKINGATLDLDESPKTRQNQNDFLQINIQTCMTSTESSSEDDEMPRFMYQNQKPTKVFRRKNSVPSETKPKIATKPKIVDRQTTRFQKPQQPQATTTQTVHVAKGDKDHEMVCPHCKFRWNVNLQLEAKKDLDYFKRRFNIDMPFNVNSNTAYNTQLFSYLNAAKRRAETAPVVSRPKINTNPTGTSFTCQHCCGSLDAGNYCTNGSCQNLYSATRPGAEQLRFHCCGGSVPQVQQQPSQNTSTENAQDMTNSYLSNNPIFNTIQRRCNTTTSNSAPNVQTSATNVPGSYTVQQSNNNSSNNGSNISTNNQTVSSVNGQSGTQPNTTFQQNFGLCNHGCKLYTPFASINPWNTLKYVNGMTTMAGNTNRFVNTNSANANQFPTPFYWS